MRRFNTVFQGLAVLLCVGPAFAAEDPKLLPKQTDLVKEEKAKGWDPGLLLGLSLSLSSNSGFVGQPDGHAFTGGLNLLGTLDLIDGAIDWRNTLKVNEVYTRTPAIDDFVKTVDLLALESAFYYHLASRFGPFASFKLETSLLEGRDVRASAIDFSVDGRVIAEDATSVRLTAPFEPLHLREALGLFLSPFATKALHLDLRTGFGAAQTFAEGARRRADDAATADVIELTALEDVVQAGWVLGLDAKGELEEGRVVYALTAEVMMPLINDDPAGRDVVDLTNLDFGAKLGFKLFAWASLDYELKVLRLPQLVDDWQIQSNLLLTLSYALVE
jgi:hypothetical protein